LISQSSNPTLEHKNGKEEQKVPLPTNNLASINQYLKNIIERHSWIYEDKQESLGYQQLNYGLDKWRYPSGVVFISTLQITNF